MKLIEKLKAAKAARKQGTALDAGANLIKQAREFGEAWRSAFADDKITAEEAAILAAEGRDVLRALRSLRSVVRLGKNAAAVVEDAPAPVSAEEAPQ